MKKRLQDLMAWADARQPRERALLLAAFAAVAFCLWDLALMSPLREQRQTLDTNVQDVEQQIQTLQVEGEKILHANSLDPNRELQDRSETLSRQIEALDAKIREHTVTLIPPKEMARFLEELLNEETALRLVRLENLGPEPLLDTPQPATGANESSPGLFRHGFVIELGGDYLSMLSYLRALEALPWDFFWEALEYEVKEYPEGRATLRAYTVSADEVWVGV